MGAMFDGYRNCVAWIAVLNRIFRQCGQVNQFRRNGYCLRQLIHEEGQIMCPRERDAAGKKHRFEGFLCGLLCMKTEVFVKHAASPLKSGQSKIALRISQPVLW